MKTSFLCLAKTVALLCITCFAAYAEDTPTLQQQSPMSALKNSNERFLTLSIENDLFGSGSDRDYTSGIRLTYFDVTDVPKKLAGILEDVIPFFSINETTSVSYSIGHNLYTPEDITILEPQPADRPWAAFLYLSMGLSSVVDNHVDDVEATIGVVGPWAQGESVQKLFHEAIDTRDPKGWENQLGNEPGLIVSWRRRWPTFWSREIGELTFSAEPNFGGSVGNIYALAEAGLMVHLVPTKSRWQDLPVLVRPSIPGSGFFQSQKDRLGWYLFGGVQVRVVERNIFFDGNTFDDSPSVDKETYVLDASAGVTFTFDKARIGYTMVYRTKEHEGQDDESLFGAISFSVRF